MGVNGCARLTVAILPVPIDDVPLPHALLTAQAINAIDRNAAGVADLLLERIGRPD